MNLFIKYILLFLLFKLLFLNVLFSNNEIKNVEDTSKIVIYNQLAEEYFRTNIDSCTKYSYLAFELAKTTTDKKQEILAYNMMGMIEGGERGLLKEGLFYFLIALNKAKSINDTTLLARLYHNIGVTYIQIGDLKNAEKYLKKAVIVTEQENIAYVYSSLGLVSSNVGNLDSAYYYYSKALEYTNPTDSFGIASVLSRQANVLFQKDEINLGMKKMFESTEIFLLLKDSLRIASNYIKIGEKYVDMQEYLTSKTYFDKAKKISENINNNLLKQVLYEAYSVLYEKTGDKEKALAYLKLYHNLGIRIFNIETVNQISELTVKYETIAQTQEIELLKKEKLISDQRVEAKNKLMYMLVVFILIIILFGIPILLIRKGQILANKLLVVKNIEIADKQSVTQKTPLAIDKKVVEKIKYTHSNLTEEQKNNIYGLIINALEIEKVFLQSDLSINKLAEHLSVSRTYLSQVINEKFNNRFNAIINEYRIVEARKELIKDKNIPINIIARKVGFVSKTTFNNNFKKYTGVTPSLFVKSAIF